MLGDEQSMFSLAPCLALLDTSQEKEAFMAFYRQYHRLVFHQAMQILNKEEWAEEVLQEVFLYIAEHFERFSSVSSYQAARLTVLCTTSRAYNLIRKERKEQEMQEKSTTAARDDVRAFEERMDTERVLLRRERVERMVQVIARLPETYRLPLELKMKDYTDQEISELLGISMAALYKRLQRAYAAVRAEMEATRHET